MQNALSRNDLLSLEDYSVQRDEFRQKMRAVKAARRLHLGAHFTLLFESRETIRYQIQEMLHTEKIFDAEGIREELDAYNPLIPDGDNFKATLLIEYENVEERRAMLEKLRGVEHQLWLQVGDERVNAIADEDLERSDDSKTSAVHFLRYQLSDSMVAAVKSGAGVSMGVDHPEYSVDQKIDGELLAQLKSDLA